MPAETTGQRIVREWLEALGAGIGLADRIDATLAEAEEAVRLLAGQLGECRNAFRNQRGDDLCWIGDPKDAKALPEAEFLESCRRYRNQIASERGEFAGGKTIAQLEAALAEAQRDTERLDWLESLPCAFTLHRDQTRADSVPALRGRIDFLMTEGERQ